jgi:hypothetical protein
MRSNIPYTIPIDQFVQMAKDHRFRTRTEKARSSMDVLKPDWAFYVGYTIKRQAILHKDPKHD